MPRFNVTMPQELWDRAGDVAPEGNRSWFIRRALEAALGDGVAPAEVGAVRQTEEALSPPNPVSPRASAPKVKETSELERQGLTNIAASTGLRRCEVCDREFSSPSLKRCTACNGKIVPEPAT